jgi:hypothetical protein
LLRKHSLGSAENFVYDFIIFHQNGFFFVPISLPSKNFYWCIYGEKENIFFPLY